MKTRLKMYVDINIQTLEIHSRDVMVFGLIHFFVIHVMLVDYSTEINDLFNCRFICCCFHKKEFILFIHTSSERKMNELY
jgi:hypothetical protein